MNRYVSDRINRTFLQLLAIYVIHGILHYVSLKPIKKTSDSQKLNFVMEAGHVNCTNKQCIVINGNYHSMRKNYSDDDYIMIAHQTKSDGANFNSLETSEKTKSSFCKVISIIERIIEDLKSINPYTWGIISVCIVFLLNPNDIDVIQQLIR